MNGMGACRCGCHRWDLRRCQDDVRCDRCATGCGQVPDDGVSYDGMGEYDSMTRDDDDVNDDGTYMRR